MSVEAPAAKTPRGGKRKDAPAAAATSTSSTATSSPATVRSDPDAELYTACLARSVWTLLREQDRTLIAQCTEIVLRENDVAVPPPPLWRDGLGGSTMELAAPITLATLNALERELTESVGEACELDARAHLVPTELATSPGDAPPLPTVHGDPAAFGAGLFPNGGAPASAGPPAKKGRDRKALTRLRAEPDKDLHVATIALAVWNLLTRAQVEALEQAGLDVHFAAYPGQTFVPPVWREAGGRVELRYRLPAHLVEQLRAATADVGVEVLRDAPLPDPTAPRWYVAYQKAPGAHWSENEGGPEAEQRELFAFVAGRLRAARLPDTHGVRLVAPDGSIADVVALEAPAPANDTTPPPHEASAAPVPTGTVEIRLDAIDTSPTNPRKHFDKAALEELAADFKLRGQLQPVLVRPRHDAPGRYELAFGERRWRAAGLAGWVTISAIVRELSDVEVAETQLVENAQRVDVHPLEEADAFKLLRDTHKRTVGQIAAKVHKTTVHVAQRLALCDLVAPARDAYYAERLTLGSALAIARLPAKLQAEALKEITRVERDDDGDGPPEAMSPARAIAFVRERYMLRLADAPWDRTDAKLLPAAGACDACPRRTGNQRELFADVDSPDLCTDALCWTKKHDAHWQRTAAAAKAKGQAVLSEKESRKLFGEQDWNATRMTYEGEKKYKPLDDKVWDGRKEVPVRALLKDAEVATTLARDNAGQVRELAPAAVVDKALEARRRTNSQADRATHGRGGANSKAAPSPAATKRKLEAKARPLAGAKLFTKIVTDVEKKGLGEPLARALISGAIGEYYDPSAILARRGLAVAAKGARQKRSAGAAPILALAKKLKGNELQGLLVEVLLLEGESDLSSEYWRAESSGLMRVCAALGLDFPAAVRAEVATLKAAAPAKRPAATKTKSTKRKAAAHATGRVSAVRSCRACGCTDARACPGGCSWVEWDLCSACEGEVS
jgi:ParB/RepB/Spo0J family partition protein